MSIKALGTKILDCARKETPVLLSGGRGNLPAFSLKNPNILEGCDEILIKNKGKLTKYFEGKSVEAVSETMNALGEKTEVMAEVFEALSKKLSPAEFKKYIEENKMEKLYQAYSKTGEEGLFSIFLTKFSKNGETNQALTKSNETLNKWKESIKGHLMNLTQGKNAINLGFADDELKNLYLKAFNGIKVPTGVNDDAFLYLNRLDKDIASRFDAHGLAKINVPDQLKQLNNLLSKGIDQSRNFYTAPLAAKTAGVGAGLGTGGGHAYRDGSFIIVSGKNKSIAKDGIDYVIVNDAYYNIIDDLVKKFPQQKFVRADEAIIFFNKM